MDVRDAIAGRRAVREYTAAEVDEATIRVLIEEAAQAPSAVNEQPWAFTVVRDQALLDRVSQGAKAHMLAGAAPSHVRAMLEDAAFQIFYHAPVLVLISGTRQGDWVVEDCALAAENLMLGAYAVGLGSCWIGLAQSYLKSAEGRAALGIGEAWEPVAPIILGHPKAPAPAVSRKAPEIRWVG
jgi:nitroreductase